MLAQPGSSAGSAAAGVITDYDANVYSGVEPAILMCHTHSLREEPPPQCP